MIIIKKCSKILCFEKMPYLQYRKKSIKITIMKKYESFILR